MTPQLHTIGHNGGPALEALTLDEAQELDRVQLRPSHVQRHAGAGSPLRAIVAIGRPGPIGRWTLLACGHWREIRDFDIMPAMGRRRPISARCGCCRLGYLPAPADLAAARSMEAHP